MLKCGVYVGVTVSLWGFLPSLLWLKGLQRLFFFWRNSRERKQPSWKQLPKWFFHPCHPLCHLPPFLISFLLLLLLTNLSLHTALHTNVSFLEPSEAGCLIEVSQVYGQSWGEATVNSSLCYQPRGSHNDTDMHTQASTLPHAHKCTHAHTQGNLSIPNKSLL